MDIAWHWTGRGTFIIRGPIYLGGSLWCKLLLDTDGQEVELNGIYQYPDDAAKSISSGEHDGKLGFPASSLGVPPKFSEWNGKKAIDGT
jgi:hypothetical protein